MMLQKKKSGFILLEAVLAILLMSMASYGLAMTSALQFNQLEAKQVANEAEQYAMNEVEYLRRVGFDDLDEALHDRKSNLEFSGVDGWESVTSFVTEKAIDDDRSIKIAKVEVYKEGENIPRYSMEVPLSSQSNGVNELMPNWEKAMLITGPFTASQSGMVTLYTHGTNSSGSTNIYINNHYVGEIHCWTGCNSTVASYILGKGDTIEFSNLWTTCYFIPFD